MGLCSCSNLELLCFQVMCEFAGVGLAQSLKNALFFLLVGDRDFTPRLFHLTHSTNTLDPGIHFGVPTPI